MNIKKLFAFLGILSVLLSVVYYVVGAGGMLLLLFIGFALIVLSYRC